MKVWMFWIAPAVCLEHMVWEAEMGRADEIPVKLTCCFPRCLAVPLPLCCEFVLDRRHQPLLSSVTQTSLWFSVSRWELRKTHEFQTAVEVFQISRKGGEDKRKGRQTERVRDNAHKKEERRDVCHCFSSQWFGHQAGTLMHCNAFFKLWAGLKLCLVPETGVKV